MDFCDLTYWGRATHICVSTTYQHWLRKWLVACSAPSHYLNHCCHVVNQGIRSTFQWNFIQNSKVFFQGNALENVVCEMTAILSRSQCVKVHEVRYSMEVWYRRTNIGTIDDLFHISYLIKFLLLLQSYSLYSILYDKTGPRSYCLGICMLHRMLRNIFWKRLCELFSFFFYSADMTATRFSPV